MIGSRKYHGPRVEKCAQQVYATFLRPYAEESGEIQLKLDCTVIYDKSVILELKRKIEEEK